MSTQRSRGLLGRLFNLIRGVFAVWIRDGEERSPRAVYESAIQERTRQYHALKEAVSGILYMRNKLEAELDERRVELARTLEDVRRAVRRGQDEIAVTLIAHKQALLEELERSERELEGVRTEAEDAKHNLVRFREEIRGLVREKGRMLATLANAQARRRIQQALEGLSVDAEMRALEGVREHIAKAATEGSLEREIGEDEGLRQRLRAIRDDARTEGARRELEELKRQYRPQALAEPSAAGGAVSTSAFERALPVPVL